MSEPYEVKLLAGLKAAVQNIRIANGFASDIGKNVFLSDEKLDIEDAKEAFVNIHDGEEQPISQDFAHRQCELMVDFEIAIPGDRPEVRTLARQALADLRQALLQAYPNIAPAPVNMRILDRQLPHLAAGSGWQLAVQRVAFQMLDNIPLPT